MKILVFVHELVLGGTTVNSIELAATLRDNHGHDVVVFATPGPMVKLVEENRLRYIAAPAAPFNPSLARTRALRAAVRSERPDLIHAWESWPCIDAYYGVHLPMGIPMIVTDMQMQLTRLLPKELITSFGTPEVVDKAKAAGRRKAELILPPVDLRRNAPGVVDATDLRRRAGIQPGEITLVTVSRLVESMKGESLLRTIDAVRMLAGDMPLRFLIVGDGSARERIQHVADEANARLGRRVVVVTGPMLDPRPAYEAADIVVGMGSSALRAMAFGKPVIVVGERGFCAPFTPDTAKHFHYTGFYGMGDGDRGNQRLTAEIRSLAERPQDLPALGEFSRRFVEAHFSLDVVASQLSGMCEAALVDSPSRPAATMDALRTIAVYLRERRFLWRAVPAAPIKRMDA